MLTAYMFTFELKLRILLRKLRRYSLAFWAGYFRIFL
jgi:hypothetical protein